MHVSLIDSALYAVKQLGAYFSPQKPSSDINALLQLNPQIEYNGLPFLSDTSAWIKIEGDLIASGVESYLTIGNFKSDSMTDTLKVGESSGGLLNWNTSGYFLDSVSLVLDTSWHVGVEEWETEQSFSLYPNPNEGVFSVQINTPNKAMMQLSLWDVSGKMVYSTRLLNGANELQANLSEGLYLYRVNVNKETKWTGKVSIHSY